MNDDGLREGECGAQMECVDSPVVEGDDEQDGPGPVCCSCVMMILVFLAMIVGGLLARWRWWR